MKWQHVLRVGLPGERYGRWLVVGESGRAGRRRRVLCACDCGARRVVLVASLQNRKSRSCGCLHRETSAELGRRSATHGRSSTREYRIWQGILSRCLVRRNHSWPRYGGRGIKVCTAWLRFERFFADVGPPPSPTHSIDRIDRNGHYEPGNVRWATPKEQGNNTSRNHFLDARGERKTIAQWAEVSGLPPKHIEARLRLGWEAERAIFSPRVGRADALRVNRLLARHIGGKA